MSQKEQFPLDKLQEALSETKKVKVRLAPLIAQFQKNNLQWLYQTLHYLKTYMTKPKINLKYKFNAIFAIKVLFDTSDFLLVNWIEIFFLQELEKIIFFGLKQSEKDRGKDYFLKMGYSLEQQPQVEKYGYNYCILAGELLQVATKVKPYKLFESEQTTQPSEYTHTLERLIKNGFKPSQKLVIYNKPQVITSQIQNYKKNLEQLSEQFLDKYDELSTTKLQQYLSTQEPHPTEQEKYGINIVSVYQSGDLYITSSAIEICKAQLTQPQSLETLKNSLSILHRLMIAADYETYFVLNYEDSMNFLIQEIVQMSGQSSNGGDRSLERGKKYLQKHFTNKRKYTEKDYKEIYCMVMECLQKWSQLQISKQKKAQNMIRVVYLFLKDKCKLEFPSMKNWKEQKERFNQAKKNNTQRNQRLQDEIEHKKSALEELINSLQVGILNLGLKEASIESKAKSGSGIGSKSSIPKEQKSEKKSPVVSSQTSIKEHPDSSSNPNPNLNPNLNPKSSSKISDSKKRNEDSFQNEALHHHSIKEETPSGPSSGLHPFKQKMLKNQQIYKVFHQDSVNYDKNRLTLKEFVDTFESQLEKVPQNVFDEVFADAMKLSEDIQQILKKPKPSFKSSSNLPPPSSSQSKIKESQKSIESPPKQQSPQRTVIEQKKVPSTSNLKIQTNQPPSSLGYKNPQNDLDTPVKRISFEDNESQVRGQKLGYLEQNSNKVSIKKQEQQRFNRFSYELKQHSTVRKTQQKIQSKQDLNGKNLNIGYEAYQQSQKKTQNLGYSNYINEEGSLNEKKQPIHTSMKRTETLKNSKNELSESSHQKGHKKLQSLNEVNPNSQQSMDVNFQKKSNHFQHEIQIEALGEQIEDHFQVNKPRQFKSLGRKRLSQQQQQQSQGTIPGKSLSPFQKPNSQIDQNFQRSSVSNYSPNALKSKVQQQQSHLSLQQESKQKYLLNDEINIPQSDPMQESFHDLEQIEEKIKKSQVPSFKKCFESDKYVMPNDKKSKMYWLESQTANLIRNINQGNGNKRSRIRTSNVKSKISVPQILEERNKKFQEQIKMVEQTKNSKIKDLQNKVKMLQAEGKSMKDQLQYQKSQLRTLRANSQADRQSQGKKGYLQDIESMAAHHKYQTPSKLNAGFSHAPRVNFTNSNFKESSRLLDPTGKLISSKLYKGYFEQFKKEKEKKGLLKNKELLHKDKFIEIGCMGKRENRQLHIVLYLTPERDLQSVEWNILQSQNLHINSQPRHLLTVNAKKQQKIFLTIDIQRVPYLLPIIQFRFYTIDGQTRNISLKIPCSFQKFIHIKEVDDKTINAWFNSKENIIRGEEVPYSKKIIKNLDILKEYFPTVAVLNGGQTNTQGEIEYGGIAIYENLEFPLRICIKPNQFLYVQSSVSKIGPSQRQRQKQSSIMNFYVCLITHLLMKEIE